MQKTFLSLAIIFSVFVSFAQTYQSKMSSFLNLVDNYYVEKVNMDSIVEVGIKSMLIGLDPH
ncbi:MAG: hypothetical protein KDC60_05775, partial [Bacteroidetes bacterium]|nr:hypothetical protein [Bacteroidota bacterium]